MWRWTDVGWQLMGRRGPEGLECGRGTVTRLLPPAHCSPPACQPTCLPSSKASREALGWFMGRRGQPQSARAEGRAVGSSRRLILGR